MAADLSSEFYGAYYHEYVAVRLRRAPAEMLNSTQIEQFIDANPDPDVQLRRAMEETALTHELRHFHDCFGTLAGITLFGSYLIELRAFLDVSTFLWRQNLPWRLPLSRWVEEPDCPEPVREFAAKHRRYVLARDVFMGAVWPPTQTGHTEDIWSRVELVGSDLSFPVYPLKHAAAVFDHTLPDHAARTLLAQAASGTGGYGGAHGDFPVDLTTVWHPLGFECLLEGNAQSLQRDVLEALWPRNIAERVWNEMTGSVDKISAEAIDAARARASIELALPYNVVDYLLTKYLRQRHAIRSFPRPLVLKVADTALMSTRAPALGVPSTGHPGTALVSLIGATEWTGDLMKCVSAPWLPRQSIEAYRASLAEAPDLTTVLSRRGFASPVNVVESLVTHNVVLPLLDLRLKYGHEVFNDEREYMEHLAEFPQPPFIITPGGIIPSAEINDVILQKWFEYSMMRSVMAQVTADSSVVYCPRAYASTPAIELVEFAHSGSCRDHIRKRNCMAWSTGHLSKLPDCVFSAMMGALGFGR